MWVLPEVRLAYSVGFTRRDQAELIPIVELWKDEIKKAWHEHFGDSSSV
ncbi:MAG TPA: hypothetical protein VE690_01465 [Rhodopila sp.]|nr:hypothetical protein [Rhodopila sp.]